MTALAVGEEPRYVIAGMLHAGELDAAGDDAQRLPPGPRPGLPLLRDARLGEQSREPGPVGAAADSADAQVRMVVEHVRAEGAPAGE